MAVCTGNRCLVGHAGGGGKKLPRIWAYKRFGHRIGRRTRRNPRRLRSHPLLPCSATYQSPTRGKDFGPTIPPTVARRNCGISVPDSRSEFALVFFRVLAERSSSRTLWISQLVPRQTVVLPVHTNALLQSRSGAGPRQCSRRMRCVRSKGGGFRIHERDCLFAKAEVILKSYG